MNSPFAPNTAETIFRSLDQPMWLYDPSSLRIIVANSAAIHEYGYSQEEFQNLTIYDIRPPEDAAALSEFLGRARGRTARTAPVRHQTKDGTIRFVEILRSQVEYMGKPARLILAIDRTESVRAQQRAESLLERFEVAAEAANMALWELDLKTGEIQWSKKTSTIFGSGAGDVRPSRDWWAENIHPDDRARVLKSVDEHAANLSSRWQSNYRFRRTDGSYFQAWESAIVLLEPDGSPRCAIGVLADVTDSRRIQRERQRLIELSADIIFAIDREHHVVWVNDALQRTLGWNTSDVVGLDPIRIVHPDDVEPTKRALDDRIEGNEVGFVENRVRATNGEYRWFQWRITPDQDLGTTYCVARDITEAREAAEAIHQREADLARSLAERQVILDRSLDVICTVDKEGQFLSVSQASETVFGYPPEAMIGHPFYEFLHPEDVARTSEYVAVLIAGGSQSGFSNRYLRPDGSTVDIMWSSQWNSDDQMHVAVARDVTELKASRRRLEETLAVAKDLAEQAQRASEAKSRFLQTMSHEIRTPMNGVLGMAQLLEATALDAEQRECLGILASSAENLMALLDDILEFSRDPGPRHLRSEPFDLEQVVRQSTEMFQGQAKSRQIRLEFVAGDLAVRRVFGDPLRVRQIVANLVGNAVKFTPAGSVTVTLGLLVGADQTAEIEIDVADTGIGIAEENLERVFEPFFQEDMSSTRAYGGSGLGLAIVSQLVDAMGGKLSVRSKVGQGTTFAVRLELPFEDDLAVSRPRVLLSGESDVDVVMLESWLRHAGFTPLVVHPDRLPRAAIAANCDAIVLDVPVSVALVREIKEGLHDVPVIVVANTDKALGADSQLAKPVHFGFLESELRRLLRHDAG